MSGSHKNLSLDGKLKLGFVLNAGFTVFEFLVGFSTGSLALISDAGHNLTDSLSLVISYFGNKISKRTASNEHTYGFGRVSIIAALINALILIGLALFIFYEAYQRILNPEPVQGIWIAVVALVGICINGSIALLFRNEQTDLNVKSAYINMLFDALASVAALIAGILIIVTKQTIFDPIASIIIGLFILHAGWGVVRDALNILLEGVPEGIDMEEVKKTILENSVIKNVDDLHIWAISSTMSAMSCHIVIEDCSMEESTKLVNEIKQKLKDNFHIDHATIEVELVSCPPKSA